MMNKAAIALQCKLSSKIIAVLLFIRYPQIGRQYGIKNEAAIAFQCKLNDTIIAALLFIPYRLSYLTVSVVGAGA